MVVAQKLKEAEITEQDSLLLTRNLLRIALFNISYLRGLFPEKYFNDKSVPALEMKIKKLMPMDAESRRLIDWMEKGVYDALQKKYLKTLLFCVCEAIDGQMIEEYAFSFSYSNSDNQEVSMNINRTGNKKGGTFKCNSSIEITPQQMRSSACKMIRTLVQLMRTLDKMPEERTILMKLLYYDDVTPVDYEPPYFRSCTEEEAHNTWTKSPLRMEVGNVNSKHFVLALKVKSVLDPCGDENNDSQDDEVSLGTNHAQGGENSNSDSEDYPTQENQFIVVPVDKQQAEEDNGIIDEDDTQDPVEDEEQLARVKDWINSYHLDTIELTDVLSNFPDISLVLTEEILDNLVKEGVLSRTGEDSYTINNQKKPDFEFMVKEEMDGQAVPIDEKSPKVDDHMYMKALYHALPMEYVTVAKLQNKLDGQANQSTVRRLITKMAHDGFIEAKGNRRLGKRVIRSILTEKKLMEVKKALNSDFMDVDVNEPPKKSKNPESYSTVSNYRDMSTCGLLHSVGSDMTRMKSKSDMHQNGSTGSEQTISKTKENGNTPTSRAEPVASRESFIPGYEKSKANGNCDEADNVICSGPSQERRGRKASMVKDPILQYMKRQKSQPI
ncbi:hypothetical protein SLE2022_048060 [Rubroshorea leprosula]